jgi:hypothetical protein
LNSSLEITQALLHELLHYDPSTGTFTWKRRDCKWFKNEPNCRTWNARYAGVPTGTPDSRGRPQIRIFKRRYLSLRLAWLYVYGTWPPRDVGHKDHNYQNLRITNLHTVTRAQACAASKPHSNNTSGAHGVSYDRHCGYWIASIRANGRSIRIGAFDDIEVALAARQAAELKYHGKFAHHLQTFPEEKQ